MNIVIDLLSLNTERGNCERPSMLHNKEFRAIAASDASTAARHPAARVSLLGFKAL